MPDHFDLAAAEANIRSAIAASIVQADMLIAEGKVDRNLVLIQREFDECRLQFVLAQLRAANAGYDRDRILSASGYSLGMLWTSGLEGCVGARERGMFNSWLQRGLADGIGAQAAAKTMGTVLTPMEAGHA